MFKRILALIAVLLLAFSLTALSGTPEQTQATEVYDGIPVDIEVNEDGYYSLFGEVEISYADGEVEHLRVKEPTLLAYSVSSERGGVTVLDLRESEQIISELSQVKEALEASGERELSEKVESALTALANSTRMTNAST